MNFKKDRLIEGIHKNKTLIYNIAMEIIIISLMLHHDDLTRKTVDIVETFKKQIEC